MPALSTWRAWKSSSTFHRSWCAAPSCPAAARRSSPSPAHSKRWPSTCASRCRLRLPALSAAAERALRQALPAFIPPSNPLDLTAQGLVDPGLYRRTLPAVLEDDGFGSVLLGIILTDPRTTAIKLPPILDAIRALRPRKPMIFAALDEGAPFEFAELDHLRELGVACFPSPERAIRALAHVTWLASQDGLEREHPGSRTGEYSICLQEFCLNTRASDCWRNFGITIPEGRLARSQRRSYKLCARDGIPGGVEGAGSRPAAQIRCRRRAARIGVGRSGCRGVVCAAEQYRALESGFSAGWRAGGTHGRQRAWS